MDLINIMRKVIDKTQVRINEYDEAIKKLNELKSIDTYWFYSLSEKDKVYMDMLKDYLGLQDVSEVNEITTCKIREVSILLRDSVSLRLIEVEHALYERDIKAMRNLQEVIDKEELYYYLIVPIDRVLQAQQTIVSKSTELQKETTTLFRGFLKLFHALAVSEETLELLHKILLN